MTIERNPVRPAEPGLPEQTTPGAAPAGSTDDPTPVQIRLQILSTEHWSLLASRSLAWNEIFSRAGMFLSTLSGSIVALDLIAGVDGFGDAFFVFALVILPVVLFVGFGTWERMGAPNYHDAMTVFGMNRIRGGYLEIAPDLERYFVMGVHDDALGIEITQGLPPGTSGAIHLVASTPFLVVVLNAVIAGAIAAIAVVRFLRPDAPLVVLVGLAVAVLAFAAQMRAARRRVAAGRRAIQPLFPTAGGDRR